MVVQWFSHYVIHARIRVMRKGVSARSEYRIEGGATYHEQLAVKTRTQQNSEAVRPHFRTFQPHDVSKTEHAYYTNTKDHAPNSQAETHSEPDHVPKYFTPVSTVLLGGIALPTDPSAKSVIVSSENVVPFDIASSSGWESRRAGG